MDATSSQHRSPLDLAHLDSLHRLSQGEAQVPHPLTRDLPQFLPILRVGTPAVGIFFDIFIGQHHFESSTSMIEVQDILDQEPVSVKCGDEEFVDPLTRLPTAMSFPGGGAACRTTITRTGGKSRQGSSHPPSKRSTISPLFILVTLAVGG